VRQAGMNICCGGIIAMGETAEQRVEMAFELKELDAAGINSTLVGNYLTTSGKPLNQEIYNLEAAGFAVK